MTESSPTTYRVTAVNATVRDRPGGSPLRRLSKGETFQGRPSGTAWVVRLDEDGLTITGYIRAVNVERI
jgi:hypothetical protein